MKKKVIFVGGHHGAGKSALCAKLVERHGFMAVRQRHIIIEAGKSRGLESWEQIGPLHEELLMEATVAFAERLQTSSFGTAVMDCHFAIRRDKALRSGARTATEQYIHDLDPIFARALAASFQTAFVLVETAPEIAAARLQARLTQWERQDHALGEIVAQQRAEREFLSRLQQAIGIPSVDVTFVRNDGRLDETVRTVEGIVLGF